MKITQLKHDIYADLRDRGNSDKDIEQMTPEEAFDEYCNWHGLIEWGPRLRQVMKDIESAKS